MNLCAALDFLCSQGHARAHEYTLLEVNTYAQLASQRLKAMYGERK